MSKEIQKKKNAEEIEEILEPEKQKKPRDGKDKKDQKSGKEQNDQKELKEREVLLELTKRLPPWYLQHKRNLPWRDTGDPYDVWLSEIMLQQTRVEAVKGYFLRFKRALPSIEALAACEDETLLKLWEGLGYYSRVRNLKKAAAVIVSEYGGRLPKERAKLLKLPGIGSYTAGAISSIAYGNPVPAVDGNVLRVCARLTGDDSDIALPGTKKKLEAMLEAVMQRRMEETFFGGEAEHQKESQKEGEQASGKEPVSLQTKPAMKENRFRPDMFNQALMELGAIVCLPNGAPLCGECPMQAVCVAKKEGRRAELPVKSAKKPRRIEERTVFLIQNGDRYLIRKRPQKGLLAGLWELPQAEGFLSEAEALLRVREAGFEPLYIERLRDAKHIFTHIEWHMHAYRLKLPADTRSEAVFADAKELKEVYALPSAFEAYWELIRGEREALAKN